MITRKRLSIYDHFKNTYRTLSLVPNSDIEYRPHNKFIIWEFATRPFPHNNLYVLCLNYEIGWPPRVWVVEPDLTGKGNLPHTYTSENNRLCLYRSTDWAWDSSCDIMKTVVLWSQMWLFYYEDYLITGQWRGPEADHDEREKKVENSKTNKSTKTQKPLFLKAYPIRLARTKKTSQFKI